MTCQASPDDGVGRTNPNAGAYKNIGINDHTHGNMVSKMPPIVTTKHNLLDAITAHLTTNLLLGLYVLLGGQWCYW